MTSNRWTTANDAKKVCPKILNWLLNSTGSQPKSFCQRSIRGVGLVVFMQDASSLTDLRCLDTDLFPLQPKVRCGRTADIKKKKKVTGAADSFKQRDTRTQIGQRSPVSQNLVRSRDYRKKTTNLVRFRSEVPRFFPPGITRRNGRTLRETKGTSGRCQRRWRRRRRQLKRTGQQKHQ